MKRFSRFTLLFKQTLLCCLPHFPSTLQFYALKWKLKCEIGNRPERRALICLISGPVGNGISNSTRSGPSCAVGTFGQRPQARIASSWSSSYCMDVLKPTRTEKHDLQFVSQQLKASGFIFIFLTEVTSHLIFFISSSKQPDCLLTF